MKLVFVSVLAAAALLVSGPAMAGHRTSHAMHDVIDAVSGNHDGQSHHRRRNHHNDDDGEHHAPRHNSHHYSGHDNGSC